jgi:trans-2,3-dihydro-3-hydroxyanthranilate isomerase
VVEAPQAPLTIDLRYKIVDVFSDRPLAGNGLCVVLDPCPEPVMQAIAREVNLSETTFPTVTAPDAYEMRIFTPAAELPFAGHPSVGTAWTLGPQRWTQTTSGAVVDIEADAGGAVMGQPDPAFQEWDPTPPMHALGLSTAIGAWLANVGGMRHLIVLTESPIDDLEPDMNAMATDRGTAAVRRVDDRTLQVRLFVKGIGEDPGTGSAAGAVALLGRQHLGTGIDVTIRQGLEMGRPCVIDVHAEQGAVTVGGRVSLCAEGVFRL